MNENSAIEIPPRAVDQMNAFGDALAASERPAVEIDILGLDKFYDAPLPGLGLERTAALCWHDGVLYQWWDSIYNGIHGCWVKISTR